MVEPRTVKTDVCLRCAGVSVFVGSSVTGRRAGRPRADLHADDSRSDRRHVSMCSHRRCSLGRLRRIRLQRTRHQNQPRSGRLREHLITALQAEAVDT